MLGTARRATHAARAGASALRLLNGATPHEVVWRSGPACLRHYAPEGEPQGTPLLLVTPIINRFRIVDLHPEGSLVGSLVERGIPVYVADWGAPRRIDADLDFEDYVLRFLPGMLDAIGKSPALGEGAQPQADRRAQSSTIDVLGYCLGGTLAVLFAATHPARLRRLVTLCAPVAFLDAPDMDLFRQWTDRRYFPVERLTSAFGTMPGRLVQQGFLWTAPMVSALKLHGAWKKFDKPGFADLFCALESWNNDAVDIPGAVYRRLILDLYQDDKLARGIFELRGEPVDLKRITCPLLVITAAKDTTCPPAAADALIELSGSVRAETLSLRGGHVLPVVGPKAKVQLHTPLADWLLAQ